MDTTSTATPSQVRFFVGSTFIQLSDGTPVVLRPLQTQDARRVLEMHDRLSADTIYFRYLHPYKPTVEQVESVARLNGADGAAFVAIVKEPDREKVIGLGYYQTEAESPDTGQPAFLVEDDYQNRGLGRALARLIIEHARMNGIRVFDALIHPSNQRMMRLIQASGFSYEAKQSYGAYQVRVSLLDPDKKNQ